MPPAFYGILALLVIVTPLYRLPAGLLLYGPVPLALLVGVYLFDDASRVVVLPRSDHCVWCGYDLRENTGGRCPECGEAVG